MECRNNVRFSFWVNDCPSKCPYIKGGQKYGTFKCREIRGTKKVYHVWNFLTSYLIENGVDTFSKNIVDFYDIGRLYEIGLAIENKYSKKEAGKYYTPRDVSKLMADLLIENNQLNCVADVGCGCGNLIIEVLSKIKERSLDEFNNVISNLYLFDLDKTAINICKARLGRLILYLL